MKDKEEIKTYIKQLESFGYDLAVECKCKNCEKEQEVDIDWTSFFIV